MNAPPATGEYHLKLLIKKSNFSKMLTFFKEFLLCPKMEHRLRKSKLAQSVKTAVSFVARNVT